MTDTDSPGPDVWAPRPPWELPSEAAPPSDAADAGAAEAPADEVDGVDAATEADADDAAAIVGAEATTPDASSGPAPSWGPIGIRDTPGGDQLRRLRDELAGTGARLTGAGAELDGEIERRQQLQHELDEARRFARDQYERACRAEDLVAELRTALTVADGEIARLRARRDADRDAMRSAVAAANDTLTSALADLDTVAPEAPAGDDATGED